MNERMGKIHHVHFIGIGGAGMGGIAEVLVNLGYAVQGSDLKPNAITERLEKLGARIHRGHDPANLGEADVVVVTSAVPQGNVEVMEAHRRRIPVVQRAEMLAELMRFRYGIAVAGTHGKTTTTSLIASMLAEGGLDPTYVIGGRLLGADANARLGSGRYLVAEADESDASFLHLQPMMAVVTNIDADHLGSYEGEMERLKQGFVGFLRNLPFHGLAVMCRDDANTRELIPDLGRRVTSYGLSHFADVSAEKVRAEGLSTSFAVRRPDRPPLPLKLRLPGTHNVLNALAAVAVVTELGVSDRAIRRALAEFSGIDRRIEVLGTVTTPSGRVTFVDDYGHHPTEIAATLQAVRQVWPNRRLVVAFQPHRYTRTHELIDDFARVLSDTDALLLTEVYGVGETPIAGADGRSLARAVRSRGAVEPVFVEELDDLPKILRRVVRRDDVVLTLGAGSIGAAARRLPSAMAVKGPVGVKR